MDEDDGPESANRSGVYICFDNSNLFIGGKKWRARQRRGFRFELDHQWRYHAEHLVKYILSGRRKAWLRVCGSQPPLGDSFWEKCRSEACVDDVCLSTRLTGREKEVDPEVCIGIIQDVTRVALGGLCERSRADIYASRVYALVCGDRDMVSAVHKALTWGFRVELYTWRLQTSRQYFNFLHPDDLAAMEETRSSTGGPNYTEKWGRSFSMFFLDDFADKFTKEPATFKVKYDQLQNFPVITVLGMEDTSAKHQVDVHKLSVELQTRGWLVDILLRDRALLMVLDGRCRGKDERQVIATLKEKVGDDRVISFAEWQGCSGLQAEAGEIEVKSWDSCAACAELVETSDEQEQSQDDDGRDGWCFARNKSASLRHKRKSDREQHRDTGICPFREFCLGFFPPAVKRKTCESYHSDAELKLFYDNSGRTPFRCNKGYYLNTRCPSHEDSAEELECPFWHPDQMRLCYNCLMFYWDSHGEVASCRDCVRKCPHCRDEYEDRPLMLASCAAVEYCSRRDNQCGQSGHEELWAKDGQCCTCLFGHSGCK